MTDTKSATRPPSATCYHVGVMHTWVEGTRRNPIIATVLCGKCWRRVSPALDIMAACDLAAIRRHRKRRLHRQGRAIR